jgi:leucyl aminopeptidase
MKLRCTIQPSAMARAEAAVAFVRQTADGPRAITPDWPRAAARLVDAWLKRHFFSADAAEAAVFPTWDRGGPRAIVLAGLGDETPSLPAWRVERAAAAAVRLARRHGLKRLAVSADDGRDGRLYAPAAAARLIARGAHEGNYRFREYLAAPGKPAPDVAPIESVTVVARRAAAAVREGRIEGETFDRVRDLANRPGNAAAPSDIAAWARGMARRCGLGCQVLGAGALRKAGFGALLAVARGSRQPPCLIVLRWPGRRGSGRPVALVGKTITFDSGGISLKPGKGMEWMRYDKCGGMAVLAAMEAAARLNVDVPVVGILAAAENMPDGDATRPGDIVRALSGKTIEILNTDAEGRLILADALAWTARLRPRAVVDLATLTGAVIVALGHAASAVLASDETLAEALRAAGEASGDRLWPLPLWPEYDRDLKSDFADLKNIGDGSAGTIIGAAFLKNFAPDGVAWAHLDIAGTAWEERERGWRGPGATLAGARLLVEWLRGLPAREARAARKGRST